MSGQGNIIFVTGEAGLGKSRLMAEMRRQFADRSLLWLEGRALSYSRMLSYSPFLEILRSSVGITDDDGDAESWAKLARRVTALFPEKVAEILPYLATLMVLEVREAFAERVKYLDGESMGGQIFRTMRHFFTRLAQEQPVVLVLEDLHWADQTSVALLEHLLPLVEAVPILFCCISRTEHQSPAAQVQELAAQQFAERYTEIALAPLSTSESTHLMRNLLEMDDLPPRLQALILNTVEGNPFFLEEVIRALIDHGALVQDKTTGHWRAHSRVDQITIPDTLQGVIMARIDRLEDDVKEVLRWPPSSDAPFHIPCCAPSLKTIKPWIGT